MGFPDSSVGKESVCNAGEPGSIPGLGRSPGEGIGYPPQYSWASLMAQTVKNPPAMLETWVGKIPWRRAWQLTPVFLPGASPWTEEEPGGLQSMVSQRVGQDWAIKHRSAMLPKEFYPVISSNYECSLEKWRHGYNLISDLTSSDKKVGRKQGYSRVRPETEWTCFYSFTLWPHGGGLNPSHLRSGAKLQTAPELCKLSHSQILFRVASPWKNELFRN